jgi:hypothetical protein
MNEQSKHEDDINPDFAAYLAQEGKIEEQEQPKQPEAQETAPEPDKPAEPKSWFDEIQDENVRAKAKAEFDALENQYRAQHGQLAPTQRKLAAMERELQQYRQAKEASKKEEAPSPGDEEWEAYKKEWPGEARAIEARFNSVQSRLEKTERELQQATERLQQISSKAERTEKIEYVKQHHPDAEEIDGSRVFHAWLDVMAKEDPILNEMMFDDNGNERVLSARQLTWIYSQYKRDAALDDLQQQQEASRAKPAATDVLTRRQQQTKDPQVGQKQSRRTPSNVPTDSDGDPDFAAFLAANNVI